MKKIDSKNGLKNTPRNKIRRIERALKTASGTQREILLDRLELWRLTNKQK